MVVRKTPEEIMRMAAAGQALAVISDVLAAAVGPGVTTAELDDLAEQQIRALGGLASFKVDAGFPTAICTSVIDEIVHGIPSGRRLRAGDVLTIDAGIVIDGFHADSTCTWIVGGDAAAPPEVGALVACTSEALWRGIAAMRIGNRLGDVSAAIGTVGERRGYGIVADHDGRVLGGHGIGRRLHEDPLVLNHGRPGRGAAPEAGVRVGNRAMFTLGTAAWRVRDDRWTVATADGAVAAHCEHTVAVPRTARGC